MANGNSNKDIKKYKKSTKRLLVCSKDNRYRFIRNMNQDIDKFVQENEPVRYNDIIAFFGTPKELADTYLEIIPYEEVHAYKTKKFIHISITIIAIVVATMSLIISLFLKLKSAKELDVIYVNESISIIEDSNVDSPD